jgi:hypothetical protein
LEKYLKISKNRKKGLRRIEAMYLLRNEAAFNTIYRRKPSIRHVI